MPCSSQCGPPPIWCVCHALTLDNAGLYTHRSGLCAKLWLALAFLVEQANYRDAVNDIVKPLAPRLRDPRDDEMEETPRRPQNKSQV